MGWISEFYFYGPEQSPTSTGPKCDKFNKRGFMLPDGTFEVSREDLTHPKWAKVIVEGDDKKQGNELYSEAYNKMPQEYREKGYYYFLLALGCIATGINEGDIGANIATNPIMKNVKQIDIERYNKKVDIIYSTVDEDYYNTLNSIWNDLMKTKGINKPDGR